MCTEWEVSCLAMPVGTYDICRASASLSRAAGFISFGGVDRKDSDPGSNTAVSDWLAGRVNVCFLGRGVWTGATRLAKGHPRFPLFLVSPATMQDGESDIIIKIYCMKKNMVPTSARKRSAGYCWPASPLPSRMMTGLACHPVGSRSMK